MAEFIEGVEGEKVEAIETACRGYIQSWLDGDADLMERVLHHGLAKRALIRDLATGELVLEESPADVMVRATGEGRGTSYEHDFQIRVFHAHGTIASAMVRSVPYHDYLHLVKVGSSWKIVNALWEPREAWFAANPDYREAFEGVVKGA